MYVRVYVYMHAHGHETHYSLELGVNQAIKPLTHKTCSYDGEHHMTLENA